MRPSQARLVTACQQLLALGVVVALLTPATGVVSLDVVGGGGAPAPAGAGAVSTAELSSATVPTHAVKPKVTEVALTGAHAQVVEPKPGALGRRAAGDAALRVTSTPQPVSGFGTVGVTWSGDQAVAEEAISVKVRTRTGSTWSGWTALDYHDEHGPDPDSAEAAHARDGTDPLLVGRVDDVQVRAAATGPMPQDLQLAVVDPGAEGTTATERPASGPVSGTAAPAAEDGVEPGDIELSAATVAQPTIYTRAQWGADEKLREKGLPSYGTINAGFVHHTVNGNDYSQADVPAIIRSIYAYHVKSRGWRDIGYNFLVDKFGRIWEGRYGGIDKPVVGAHTLGYNEYSFAMSAIGNYETAQPSDAMLRAYGQLFAWKLSLAGVDPLSTSQKVGKSTFQAINGHRDAGSTACPGKYLYAKLPLIRQYAANATPAQPSGVKVGAPTLQTNLVGSPHPDLVVRRAADGRGLVVPTGGLTSFGQKQTVSKRGWKNKRDVLVSPDVTGDGVIDLLAVSKSGVLKIRPGKGNGKFKGVSKTVKSTRGHALLSATGDLNGDGRGDLVGRKKGRLVVFLGTAKGGFKKRRGDSGLGGYKQLVGPGDVTGDGLADVLGRDNKGRLRLHRGNGDGTFAKKTVVPGSFGGYNRMVGGGDYTHDGRADLVARTGKGQVYVLPGHGDGTFGVPLGPTANLRSIGSLTAAGSLAGDPSGDLVGLKKNALVVVVNRGTYDFGAAIDAGVSFAGMAQLLNVGDWDHDGLGDVVARTDAGELRLFRGNGQGQLAAGVAIGSGFAGVSGLTPVGDVTGDGWPDLMGTPAGGRLSVYPGTGTGIGAGQVVAGRKAVQAGLPTNLSAYDWVIPTGDMQLKNRGDYIVRQRATGTLRFFNGRTSGVSKPRTIGEGWGVFDLAG